MMADSVEGSLTFKSSISHGSDSFFLSECSWDREHELAVRDVAVTTYIHYTVLPARGERRPLVQ